MKSLTKRNGLKPVEIRFEPSPDNPQQLLRVSRVSDVTGATNVMDLPVTEAQLVQWLGTDDKPGSLIQHAMPHLSSTQREFLISGCSPKEWDQLVKDELDGDEE